MAQDFSLSTAINVENHNFEALKDIKLTQNNQKLNTEFEDHTFSVF